MQQHFKGPYLCIDQDRFNLKLVHIEDKFNVQLIRNKDDCKIVDESQYYTKEQLDVKLRSVGEPDKFIPSFDARRLRHLDLNLRRRHKSQ